MPENHNNHDCVDELTNSIIENAKFIAKNWKKFDLSCDKIKRLTNVSNEISLRDIETAIAYIADFVNQNRDSLSDWMWY